MQIRDITLPFVISMSHKIGLRIGLQVRTSRSLKERRRKVNVKIKDLKSTIVTLPLQGKPERWAFGVCQPSLSAVIVELITDEGLSGWGEAICVHPSAEITKGIIESCRSFLIGRDPF